MPIRYHAQRKHIIYSLDTLLYELHTLSFLLAPSIFVLLCRCITQFQFARVRELDGRRSLAFWYGLVVLVNVSAVWSHAFGDAGSGGGGGGGGGGGNGIILDFVGMGHRPTRLQLLLLDATIIFLQALLSTIAYETSLALAMPADVADPLLPSPSPESELSTAEMGEEEVAPFLPYSSPYDRASITTASTSSSITYPPTPPCPSTSAERSRDQEQEQVPEPPFSTKPSRLDALPPRIPIIDLSLLHILHRLTSPIPEPPQRANEALDGEDDELAVLRLPLPNTTSVRVAHTLRMLAQARQRQRQREQAMARRLRRGGAGADENGSGNGEGENDVDGNREDGDGSEGRTRSGRIPGAIEDEDEG